MNKDGLNVNGTTVGSNSIKLGTAAGDLALTKTQMQVGGAAGSTLTSSSLKIGGATLNGTSLGFGSNTPSLSNNGLAMASKKITGLANGTTDNDAVNVSQLNAAKAAATTKVAASGTNINVTSIDNADGSKTYAANLNDTINLTEAGSVSIQNAVLNKDGLKVGSTKYNSSGVEFGTGNTPANYLHSNAFKIGNLTLDANGLNLASGSLVAGKHTLGEEGLNLASGSSLKVGQVSLSENGLSLGSGSQITGLGAATEAGQAVEFGQFDQAIKTAEKSAIVGRAAIGGNLKTVDPEVGSDGIKYRDFSLANQVELKGEMQEGAEVSASLEILNHEGNKTYAKLDKTGLTVGNSALADGSLRIGEGASLTADSLVIGSATLNGTSLGFGEGTPSISNEGLNMAGKTIGQVGAGAADSDAVNVAQLKAAKSELAANGKNVNVSSATNADNGTTYTVNLNDNITLAESGSLTINDAVLNKNGLRVGSAKFNGNGVEFDENHYVRGNAFKVGNLSLADAGLTLSSGALKVAENTLDSTGLSLVNGASVKVGSVTLNESGLNLKNGSQITGLKEATRSGEAVEFSQFNEALEKSEKAVIVNRAAVDGNLKSEDIKDGEATYREFSLANQVKLKEENGTDGEVSASLEILNHEGNKTYAKLDKTGLTVGNSALADGSLRIGEGASLTADSLVIGSATLNGTSLGFGEGTPSISNEGLNMAGKTIGQVGAGAADSDAVNVAQLKAAKSELAANGKNVNVSSATNADNGTTYTVNLNDNITLAESGSLTINDAELNKNGLTVGSAKFNSNGVEFDENHYVRGDAFKVGNLSLADAGLTLSSGALKVAENTLDEQGLSLASGSSVKVGGVTLNENGLNLSSGSQITGLGAATAQGQAVEYSQFDEAIKETKKSAVVTRAAANGNLIVGDQQTDEKGAYAEIALANRVKLRGEAGTEGQEVSASLEILNPDGTQSYAKLDKDGLRVGDSLSITGSSVGFTGGPALRYGSEDPIGLDMAGKRIAHVQDGVADDDAVNVRQMNANVTKLVGGSTNVVVTEDQSYEGPGKQYKVDVGNRLTFGTGSSALTLDSRGLRIGSAATFSKDEISVKSSVNGSAVIKGGSIQVSQGDSRVSIDTAQIQLGSTTISSGSIKMGGNNGLQLRSDGMIGRGRSTLQFNPETSTVAFSNQRLTGLLAGTGSQDAATVGQLERLYNHLVDKGVLPKENQPAARTAELAKAPVAGEANLGVAKAASVNTLALEDGNIVGQQTVKGLTGGANLLSAPASAVNEAVALESGNSNVGTGIAARAADYTAGSGIAINNNAISLADDIEVKSVKADSVKTKTVEASEKITVGTADNAVVIEPSRIYFSSQGPSISKSGIDAGGNRITGVADGVAPTDAVNVRQMNQVSGHLASRINDVDKRAKAGIAQAIATAGLPQAYRPGAGMASAALGTFGGQGAIAIGVSKISDNGHWVFKGTFSGNTQSKVGGSVGVGYQW